MGFLPISTHEFPPKETEAVTGSGTPPVSHAASWMPLVWVLKQHSKMNIVYFKVKINEHTLCVL